MGRARVAVAAAAAGFRLCFIVAPFHLYLVRAFFTIFILYMYIGDEIQIALVSCPRSEATEYVRIPNIIGMATHTHTKKPAFKLFDWFLSAISPFGAGLYGLLVSAAAHTAHQRQGGSQMYRLNAERDESQSLSPKGKNDRNARTHTHTHKPKQQKQLWRKRQIKSISK